MSRHITDHRPAADAPDGRLKHFMAVEKREAGPHPASLDLIKRGRMDENARRMREFLRIERGREA